MHRNSLIQSNRSTTYCAYFKYKLCLWKWVIEIICWRPRLENIVRANKLLYKISNVILGAEKSFFFFWKNQIWNFLCGACMSSRANKREYVMRNEWFIVHKYREHWRIWNHLILVPADIKSLLTVECVSALLGETRGNFSGPTGLNSKTSWLIFSVLYSFH